MMFIFSIPSRKLPSKTHLIKPLSTVSIRTKVSLPKQWHLGQHPARGRQWLLAGPSDAGRADRAGEEHVALVSVPAHQLQSTRGWSQGGTVLRGGLRHGRPSGWCLHSWVFCSFFSGNDSFVDLLLLSVTLCTNSCRGATVARCNSTSLYWRNLLLHVLGLCRRRILPAGGGMHLRGFEADSGEPFCNRFEVLRLDLWPRVVVINYRMVRVCFMTDSRYFWTCKKSNPE